jgi:hypothetical protein
MLQGEHGVKRHRAERGGIPHAHDSETVATGNVQAAHHGPCADYRSQAIIAVQQSHVGQLTHDRELGRGVDTASLQTADSIAQTRHSERIEAGWLAQGALQADRRGELGVGVWHASMLEDVHIELVIIGRLYTQRHGYFPIA